MLTILRLILSNRSVTFLAIALLAISASAITANTAHAEDPTGDTGDSEAAGLCVFSRANAF